LAKPSRDRSPSASNTYFVTANAFAGQAIFQSERMANLLIETLLDYRSQGKYFLHEFVIMPNHLHILFTTRTGITLERAIQLIKGGFSHRAGKRLEMYGEIWQRGYVDHRIRDVNDFAQHKQYIHQNPVKTNLVETPETYAFSSAFPSLNVDDPPQGLKPVS
jgi:putative transposase